MPKAPTIIKDQNYPGMWRVLWPDGQLSDMVNLSRAKDAAASFMESEARRQRGRKRPVEAPQSRYFIPEGNNYPSGASSGITSPSSSHFVS